MPSARGVRDASVRAQLPGRVALRGADTLRGLLHADRGGHQMHAVPLPLPGRRLPELAALGVAAGGRAALPAATGPRARVPTIRAEPRRPAGARGQHRQAIALRRARRDGLLPGSPVLRLVPGSRVVQVLAARLLRALRAPPPEQRAVGLAGTAELSSHSGPLTSRHSAHTHTFHQRYL